MPWSQAGLDFHLQSGTPSENESGYVNCRKRLGYFLEISVFGWNGRLEVRCRHETSDCQCGSPNQRCRMMDSPAALLQVL